MTVDQRGSRSAGDAVPALLKCLDGVRTVRGFSRTLGDEVQAVLDDPAEVAAAVRVISGAGEWHIGVGVGEVERPLAQNVAEARGAAFYAAREAVESAKSAPVNLVLIRAEGTGHGAPTNAASTDHADLAEHALRLLVRVITDMRPESMRYIDYRLAHPSSTQAEIARTFDVSQQAVSRVLSQGTVELISGGLSLCTHHLALADPTILKEAC